MKKNYLFVALAFGLCLLFGSCQKDDPEINLDGYWYLSEIRYFEGGEDRGAWNSSPMGGDMEWFFVDGPKTIWFYVVPHEEGDLDFGDVGTWELYKELWYDFYYGRKEFSDILDFLSNYNVRGSYTWSSSVLRHIEQSIESCLKSNYQEDVESEIVEQTNDSIIYKITDSYSTQIFTVIRSDKDQFDSWYAKYNAEYTWNGK